MTRGHWTIVGVSSGLPIFAWLALNFLSPGYMRAFYDPRTPYFALFLFFVALNFIVLLSGFAIYNRQRKKTKVKLDDTNENRRMPCAMIFFLIVTTLVCTVPSVWLASMGPAVSRIFLEFIGT